MSNPNALESYKEKLSEQTLRDIEGLEEGSVGFGREECCGPIPPKLKDSMKLKEHIFIGTKIPATKWDKKTGNVEGYDKISSIVKEKKMEATVTVYEVLEEEEENVLHFSLDEKAGGVVISQHNSPSLEDGLPWETPGALKADRSTECFVFVCSHASRDSRCAFCGSVLVDLIRAEVKETLGEEQAKRISVLKCSHVGGHIYAGNVLVYSRHGGVCYGLFKPVDVPALVQSLADDNGIIPISLKGRVRGQMVTKGTTSWCSSM